MDKLWLLELQLTIYPFLRSSAKNSASNVFVKQTAFYGTWNKLCNEYQNFTSDTRFSRYIINSIHLDKLEQTYSLSLSKYHWDIWRNDMNIIPDAPIN